MQLHRSRPEPRLSTFERCWLGGATGLAQRTGDTRDLFALRSPGSVSPLCPTCAPLKRTALLAKPVNGINAPQRPDCVAGHVELELRNVEANYPFEKSRRFAAIQPNFGDRDHSPLSCGVGDTQLGAGFCRDSASVLHGRRPSCGVAEKARIGRDLFRSEDDPPAAKPATPLLSLRWTFRAKRACVVIKDAEPDRLAPLTPPAPMGLRGVWVVAARFAPALRRAVAPTLLRGVLHVQAQTCAQSVLTPRVQPQA